MIHRIFENRDDFGRSDFQDISIYVLYDLYVNRKDKVSNGI